MTDQLRLNVAMPAVQPPAALMVMAAVWAPLVAAVTSSRATVPLLPVACTCSAAGVFPILPAIMLSGLLPVPSPATASSPLALAVPAIVTAAVEP